VIEAARIGVNEYLVKPVSAQALFDRMVSILIKPRPIVRIGDYYGPEPRRQYSDPIRKPFVAPTAEETPSTDTIISRWTV